MGYRVACPGAYLLRKLNDDCDQFLKAPFALYMIALASKVDDVALNWLMKYEMALDSLTGPNAAFLLFYNEASLQMGRIYPGRQLLPCRGEEATVVDVDAATLRRGIGDIERLLPYRRDEIGTKGILVRSMTYESDDIARQLGILDRLPCLLIFDDPGGKRFHLFPLVNPDDRLFVELRNLLSAFFRDPKATPYLNSIGEWHDLNNRIIEYREKLIARKRQARLRLDELANEPERWLADMGSLLMNGKHHEARNRLNRVAGRTNAMNEVPWRKVREGTNEIASSMRLARQLRKGAGKARVVGEGGGVMSLVAKAERILGKGEVDAGLAPARIEAALVAYAQRRTEDMKGIISTALDLAALNGPNPWAEEERNLNMMQNELDLLWDRIRGMGRPTFGPHLARYLKGKKMGAFITNCSVSSGGIGDKLIRIIDAVSKLSGLVT